jgi:hypothetical protein
MPVPIESPGTATGGKSFDLKDEIPVAADLAGGAPKCSSAGNGHLGAASGGRNPFFPPHDVFLTFTCGFHHQGWISNPETRLPRSDAADQLAI